jgi:hypothetical protein
LEDLSVQFNANRPPLGVDARETAAAFLHTNSRDCGLDDDESVETDRWKSSPRSTVEFMVRLSEPGECTQPLPGQVKKAVPHHLIVFSKITSV